MKFVEPKNKNYCATITALKDFVPIPKADKIQSALIFGNNVIVSKEVKAGDIGVFFPVECQLSKEFLSSNNLYRKPEWGNVDSSKNGYFEQAGRIKCAKFLGTKSEGLWVPISALSFLSTPLSAYQIGDVFDEINGVKICEKYIPEATNTGGVNKFQKKASLINSIVDGQWRFHTVTENLRKNIHKIRVTDTISISDKFHGTSLIAGKPLVFRNLNWFENLLIKLGVQISETVYGLTYSSRKMIKAVNGVDRSNGLHYYSSDIWGIVAKEIEDKIPNGFTVYGEVVGYTPEGSFIQGGYNYGCNPKEHAFYVYRVVSTNNEGKTLELSWPQMNEFCFSRGLVPVKELFYGKVTDLVPWDSAMDMRDWHEQLLKYLQSRWVHDQDCKYNPKMPAEGIVARIDYLDHCESWKLKNFRFLERESRELDKGVTDIETAESVE